MNPSGWAMILLFVALIIALAKPAGLLMYRLYAPEPMPLEKQLLRIAGVDAAREQSWVGFAAALMVFNIGGVALLFGILKLQGVLPFNPMHFAGIDNWLAFNTAVSFVTNTNWQNYGGETTMSYFSQMAGLAVQNFLSAATGIAVAFAFIAMFFGRFGVVIPALAIAGGLAAKQRVPASAGTFPTTGVLWVALLIGVIIIVGGLTYLPALALGPVADQYSVLAGHTF